MQAMEKKVRNLIGSNKIRSLTDLLPNTDASIERPIHFILMKLNKMCRNLEGKLTLCKILSESKEEKKGDLSGILFDKEQQTSAQFSETWSKQTRFEPPTSCADKADRNLANESDQIGEKQVADRVHPLPPPQRSNTVLSHYVESLFAFTRGLYP